MDGSIVSCRADVERCRGTGAYSATVNQTFRYIVKTGVNAIAFGDAMGDMGLAADPLLEPMRKGIDA